MFPAPVRLHSWYSETEDEDGDGSADGEEVPAAAAVRPLPDEISVNNLLDDVACWSADEADGGRSPPPPEEEPPPPPGEEPTGGQTPDPASPDRTSQVGRRDEPVARCGRWV